MIKKKMLPVIVFAKIDIRRLFRDKVAIFFTFAFPLIFLFIFGALNSGSSDISFKVGVLNQSDSSVAKNFAEDLKKDTTFNVDEAITNLDEAKQKMNRSEVDATIILPPEFGQSTKGSDDPSGQLTVLYDQNNEQAGKTLSSVLDAQLEGLNANYVDTKVPFSVETQSTATKGLTAFDYTFSGLLGFAILGLGVFGPVNVFPRLKSNGVLRRYHTTSLKVWQYFLGNVLSTAFVGILSVGVLFIVASLIFDLNMRGDYISLLLLTILGTVTIFGVGLGVGGWAKNEKQAAPLAQIVAFPMLFLSGTFFPRFAMPEWLQNVSGLLPLTPVIDGSRMIITEGKTIFDIGPQVGLLLIWLVVIYIIAFRVFKWE